MVLFVERRFPKVSEDVPKGENCYRNICNYEQYRRFDGSGSMAGVSLFHIPSLCIHYLYLYTVIVTVTNDAFAWGTIILLHSLRAQNPSLDVPVVVFHDTLQSYWHRRIEAIPGVELRPVPRRLTEALRVLCGRFANLAPVLPRFYSLAAFGLEEGERVLYLDSDILCVESIDFAANSDDGLPGDGLQAVPDRLGQRGGYRDPASFLPIPTNQMQPGGAAGMFVFNSGVMLLDRAVRGRDSFERLLTLLTELDWGAVRSGHTDQFLLNHAFRDQWTPLSPEWNVLVNVRSELEDHTAMKRPPIFLHYVGRSKPWQGRLGFDRNTCPEPFRSALRQWDTTATAWACERFWQHADPFPAARLTMRSFGRTLRRGYHRLRQR